MRTNIQLKPEIQRFIDEQVQAGHFDSPDEVMEEALLRMMEEGALAIDEATDAAINASEGQIESGHYRDWKEVSAKLRAKYLGK